MGVPIPAHNEVRIEPADFTQVFPVEFRADIVMTLRRDGQPVMGIIGEVQRGIDSKKWGSWPVYNAVLHAQLGCQIALVVIAEDESIARWAAKPIETVQAGSPFTPLVLGPSRVPFVTSDEHARSAPELAVLSTLVHGKTRGLDVGRPAARATVTVDLSDERRTLYLDLILSALSAVDRATLEIEMDLSDYKFKSETFRGQLAREVAKEVEKTVAKEVEKAVAKEVEKAVAKEVEKAVETARADEAAKVEARSILIVLSARQIPVNDAIRAQILACTDHETLSAWIQRAATVSNAEDVVRE